MTTRFFSSSAALQDYLLEQSGEGTLVVVPHQRLAHQVWHRQRRAALAAGRPAWEPGALLTLHAWWSELFCSLWPQEALAPALVRLSLWRQAFKIAPAPSGPTPELAWAEALDETHILLCRHLLEPKMAGGDARPTTYSGDDSPLIAWRRRITHIYTDLLRQGGWLSPGELPAYLTAALRDGRLKAPPRVLVVGLETPAPTEVLWLQELSRRTQVAHLQVRGDDQNVREAVSLPDPRQELQWVAARLVESAQGHGLPLHRLAVTAPHIDAYAPQLRRVLAELLGPPETAAGWAYNFSRGPSLADAPLFQAALLPLKFIAARECREDLVSLLLSPYYGELQGQCARLARWDQVFRERGVDRGWDRLRHTLLKSPRAEAEAGMLERLDRLWTSFSAPAPAGQWCRWLRAAWQELGFPRGLQDTEAEAWARLTGLLPEVETALGREGLGPGEFLEWLTMGAQRLVLPGPGIQAAGVQVLGLLEIRGLEFSRVFCLGMNSGALPAPPRPLPLLSAGEKRLVLGGTYQSQHHFAAELFANVRGVAPHLTLTRPRVVDQEEWVSSPLYKGEWSQAEMAVLSMPDPAWLRSPAVRATFAAPDSPAWPGYPDQLLAWDLPGQLSLSQISTALGCPCRFLLEILLKIRELPDIDTGLDPRTRGQLLHEVLARFTTAFQEILQQDQAWDHRRARELLQEAARQALAPWLGDVHWQAEWDRWLGESGLLWEWLRLERERFEAGWRWQGFEVPFADLKGEDWPFTLAGRVDRLDYHPDTDDLMVWDYKSGEIPKARKVFEDLEESQLPCYLLAVEQGRVPPDRKTASLRAGFIGLKSPRSHHLKHEDFDAPAEKWRQAAAAFAERVTALGRRLAAGDFRPDPTPAPAGRQGGACQYCLYDLVCGFAPAPAPEHSEEVE